MRQRGREAVASDGCKFKGVAEKHCRLCRSQRKLRRAGVYLQPCVHTHVPGCGHMLQAGTPSDPGTVKQLCNPAIECCMPDNSRQKINSDCDPGKYLTAKTDTPSCACEDCDVESVCKGLERATTIDPFYDYIINCNNSSNKCELTNKTSDQFKWVYTGGCHASPIKGCNTTCNRSSKCCVGDDYEVASAAAGLTCDSWSGNWDKDTDNKGCCICNDGKTFSYDPGTRTGGCCATGTAWNGTSSSCQ